MASVRSISRASRRALRLDHGSPLPLHAQAERALRTLIGRKKYRNGVLLPDEVSLSRMLGVSRNTLRAALLRLVGEGRLERKAGVGTRVAEPKLASGVGAWHSFTREMEGKGVRVETYSLQARWRTASSPVAQALKIPCRTKVLCLDRVRGWNTQPEVAFRSYFHPRLRLAPKDDFARPLYELIQERCSVLADESLEEFTAVPAGRWLARRLRVRVGTPLLRRERTVLDTGRRPMEFAVVHYRCDRFKLTLTLRQK
ncbi:MAG: GntR family transcriptional regulator [Verrucomicrobiota bacterium]|nr:GntR family transcriptional regulator [Verrucomicrobiota bacterium]